MPVWEGMGRGGWDSREEKAGFTRLRLANWGCVLTWGFLLERLDVSGSEDFRPPQLLCLSDSQKVVERRDTRNYCLWRMLF